MKKFRKLIGFACTFALTLSAFGCGKKTTTTEEPTTEEVASDTDVTTEAPYLSDPDVVVSENPLPFELPALDGQNIYIYSFDDVLGERIDTQFRSRYPEYSDMVVYKKITVDSKGPDYQTQIQEIIDNSAEDPAIIAVRDTELLYYMGWDYVIPIEESGLDISLYKESAYDYTVDFGTNEADELMALTWQVTPGMMFYNTKIAEEVLGTSDPEKIQAMVSDVDGFLEVAEQMKESKYYMVSAPDELMNPILDQRTSAFVEDGKLVLDPIVGDYLDVSKTIYKENYSANQPRGSAKWSSNMSNGKVFCYFGSSIWLTDESVFAPGQQKYNCVKGPFDYHLGGTYLLYGKNCQNKELAALLMYTLCCDEDAMYDLYEDDTDFPNNVVAVEHLLADGVGDHEKLGYQNPVSIMDAAAKQLDRSNATIYDSEIAEYITAVAASYNTGNLATLEDAYNSIQKRADEGIFAPSEEEE